MDSPIISLETGLALLENLSHRGRFTLFGKSVVWSKIVKYVPVKSKMVCEHCGAFVHHFTIDGQVVRPIVLRKDGTFDILTRDHIIPRSKGGTLARDNVRVLCRTCNNERGNYLRLEELVRVAANFPTLKIPNRHQTKPKVNRFRFHNPTKFKNQLLGNGCIQLRI